jgi:hypothetical protein
MLNPIGIGMLLYLAEGKSEMWALWSRYLGDITGVTNSRSLPQLFSVACCTWRRASVTCWLHGPTTWECQSQNINPIVFGSLLYVAEGKRDMSAPWTRYLGDIASVPILDH